MDYINHVTKMLEQLDLFQLKLEYLEEMCYNEIALEMGN